MRDLVQPEVFIPSHTPHPQADPLAVAVANGSERPIHAVRDWITLEYELARRGREPEMRPFDGPRDFVLRLGRDFPHRPLPKNVRPRSPRQCFHNAASLALRRPKEFLYAEGYAFTKGLCTEHAWCVDREGYAVDPTWQDEGPKHYLGVAFLHSYVRRQARARGELGGLINVWDGPERWPLCRGVHPLDKALADLAGWIGAVPKDGSAQ